MKKEVLANFDRLDLTTFAFFIFLTVFVGVIIWIFRRGSNSLYKNVSSLPLNDFENKAEN